MKHPHKGRLIVITGPMYSGKSGFLIKTLNKFGDDVEISAFKHASDKRFDDNKIVSRDDFLYFDAIPINTSKNLKIPEGTAVVAFDEVQFFKEDLLKTVEDLVKRGIIVYCSGLDLDFAAKPFGITPYLLAMANQVVKLTAICNVCGKPASKSYPNVDMPETLNDNPEDGVAESENFSARCNDCYYKKT